MPQFHVLRLAPAAIADGEVQRRHAPVLVHRLLKEAAAAVLEIVVRPGRGGAEALLHGERFQQPAALGGLRESIDGVDGPQQHRKQHRDGDHGRDGEFFLQRADHGFSPSVSR